ncbi:MAG: Ig-like domain-containing protein, partial [Acinetobacter sp.]
MDSGLPIGTSSVCTCTNLCTEGAVNAECPACSVNAADCEICNTQDNGSADSNADTLKDLGTATQSNAEYEVKAPCQSEAESQEYLAGIFEQESLTQEDESLFEAHLEQCAFCAEYMAQMQPMAEQYIIQKHAIKCSATYAFTINGVDAGGSCRVYEGDKVKVKITLTSVKDGYEYKRVELRSGYGATVGDNLGEIAEFTPVPGEEMTWTFTVPPKPASTYGVINVIAEEIKIDPIPAVALTSTATTMAYDTNNVGFTAKVIDTANNNAVMTDGTVQFYLNNEAVGDPVTYSSSYSGYYKGIRSYQYLDNPYLKMGENNIKVIYTAAEGGTTESNMVTVTLTKKDISYKVSAGYTTDDSTYTGTYGVGRLYFGLSGLEEDSLVKTTDFVITGTKDGKEFTPEYEYRFWNQITIKLMDAGTYTITATLKDDVTYYTASASYTVTIKKATPTVTVSSAVVQRSQGIFGGGVTLIANVGGVNNEKPTGTIQFKEGAVNIGSAVTVTEGAATYDWTGYAAGTHNITAEFTPATTGTGVNYTASKNATAYSLDIDKAVPTVTWGTTAQSTTYTGSPVLESNLTKPTVTLLSSDTFNGEIKYSYKKVGESAGESVAEYTDGLPTNAGTYEIKASVA